MKPKLIRKIVVAASCCGDVFLKQGQGCQSELMVRWMEPNTEQSYKKTRREAAKILRLGRRFASQQDNNTKHTARAAMKWVTSSSSHSQFSEPALVFRASVLYFVDISLVQHM
ncbi:hypothetical protein ATANTOWER_014405 [Ataeniobius toweri]|uniref:Uncharacterized protein n=1 Tax=Ataeniobius toweri TaxID=208326 RepID=A0ABU7AAM9_9TELE|nr:hypothetical protein [Ataeniobius toweri]